MKSGKGLLGVLAGAAAGATLGILFAPDKGSNTRKNISQKGEDMLDNLKNKFEEFVLTKPNEGESVKSEVEDLPDKGKDKAGEVENGTKHDAEDLHKSNLNRMKSNQTNKHKQKYTSSKSKV